MDVGTVTPTAAGPAEGQDWGEWFAAYEADREAAYQAKMDAERAKPHHIRKKAGPNLGNQWYSHSHRVQFIDGYVDPMSQTLCGAAAGFFDETWADARWPKNRAHVTCDQCIEIRLRDPKAKR